MSRNNSPRSSGLNFSAFRDVEFQRFLLRSQPEYQSWWTGRRLLGWARSLPEDTAWNSFICVSALFAIVWVIVDNVGGSVLDVDIFFAKLSPYILSLDILYNVVYLFHIAAIAYNIFFAMAYERITYCTIGGFMLDFVSFLHYVIKVDSHKLFKLVCYYLRLHRPFRYLWNLNDYNLKGSILGTTLKYCYIFFVLRVTWALVWVNVDTLERYHHGADTALYTLRLRQLKGTSANSSYSASQFLVAVYIVNKMFIPIGPSVAPSNDTERVACLMVMITGCLVVTGSAVASLSLVISIYMGPEEAFRTRYRLIMKEMKESNIPLRLREKVETFYKMYWHKQKAVSETQLLPAFPPTLAASIYTDIYFEATQKSRILCDLSYQFLSEVAKKMITVHYIPGDTIIKRSTRKSSIIYIAYGDIEMLSAEDDSTAVVRMTRGTAVAGCAGSLAVASARAHVDIRAATFCTAHALHAPDLWRVMMKYGRDTLQTQIILASFNEHLDRVKQHYFSKIPEEVKYKSSILHFKRNLMALKEAKDENGKLLLDRTDVFLEIAGCYIMRNRADGSQTDEADAICLRSTFPCILQPTSSLQTAWHSFICCVILAVCFLYPYYLVFTKTVPVEFRFFDYVVTALFVVDLIVHLSTGANVEEGVPITFSQTSSQQMRSQWFVLDVVATLPIFEFINDGHYAGINKLLRLPKVFRTLKFMEEMCVYNSNQLRFMSYTLLLVVACYLIAALQQAFMCFQFEYCLVSNFTHPPYWEERPLDERTVNSRLTFGLYWAISMITFTTHMEPFGVENWSSVLYTMLVLEVCIVLHIFIEAVYSATIMVTTALREDYDSCIANVKDFLIRNDVDEQLRQRFITYLQLCWYTDKAYSMTNKKKSIFFDLPPHVYQDIVTRQRSKYLLSIPFMKLLNKEDLKEVSSKAKLFHTSPNEILLNTGDISNEIYLIKKGICEIVDPDTKEVIGSLGIKSHFGVLECLLRLPAYYTVRTVTHVQVFTISLKVLTQVMQLPQVKDAIEFAKEQPEFGRLVVRRESFLQYQAPPKAPNMERFRLPRKYEQDNAFLNPFNRLGFFSILRYIFPRYSIRPDGDYLVRYEWCRAACALLSALVFPSYTYMVLQWPWLYWMTLLLDFAAYFDIAQRMLVGYFNEHGVLVYHPTSTAAHYLKGAFFADMLGCLPMEGLESPNKESFQDQYRLTESRQLLMLNRMLQLYRLPSAMTNLGGKIERRDILLVLQALLFFMALLNVLTCLMVFNSVDIFRSEGNDSWLIMPLEDQGGSWLNLFNESFRFKLTETPFNLYLATQFWVVYETTTTGYNSFNPSNFQLMHILFVGMVIGAMITTYFSVRIISIRANVNKELAAYQEHIKDMLVFMRRENLDKKLQREVLGYYEYNWEKMGGVDYTSVLKLCDQITLRTDAILHIYGPTFEKCPLLSNCDVSLLRMLGRAVRSLYFLRGMNLMEKDDVIRNIFFVDYGYVVVKDSAESTSSLTLGNEATLTKGSVFGNLEKAPTVRSPVSIVALSRIHVLQINAAAFQQIIADFPQVAAAMEQHRQQNEHYILGSSYEELKKSSPSLAVIDMPSHTVIIKHFCYNDICVQLYLIIVSLASVYADLYNAGFQSNNLLTITVLYALDVLFMMKILMMYVLPYIVPIDMKIMLMPARKAYFTNDFKYDVLSCLPLELISLGCGQHAWMAFSLLRLNRLLRVVTLYKCLKKHNSRITINLTLSTVFSVLVWFTLFVHTTTCLWHFIGLLQDRVSEKHSWIYNDAGDSLCENLYICSSYFILTTFTQNGVGDIMPKNHAEVIFVSILQIISTMLYMVYVGEFSNIIQFQSFRSFSFYCKYLELQEFLKNNRVSRNLVTVVNRYTLHFWRECRGMQVPHFLTTAPQSLKLRVMSAAFIHHLKENPVFRECEPAFLRQLVGCLQLYTYNEGMFVVKESEITDAMYLIHTGCVVETSSATGDRKQYASTECFGVEQGLIRNNPYQFTYKTVTKAQVLTLHLNDWEYLLGHFPNSKTFVYKHLRKSDDNDDSQPRGSGSIFKERTRPPSVQRSRSNVRWSPHTSTLGGPPSPPGVPPSPPDLPSTPPGGASSPPGGPPSPPSGAPSPLSGPTPTPDASLKTGGPTLNPDKQSQQVVESSLLSSEPAPQPSGSSQPGGPSFPLDGPSSSLNDPSSPLVGSSSSLTGAPKISPTLLDEGSLSRPSADKSAPLVDPSRTSARSAAKTESPTETGPIKKTRVVSPQPSISNDTDDATSRNASERPRVSLKEDPTRKGSVLKSTATTALKSKTTDTDAENMSSTRTSQTPNKTVSKSQPDIVLATSSQTDVLETQADQIKPTTEPIATHPYSRTSLQITELPPSLTELTPKTPGLVSSTSISRDMMMNEAFDIDADNELKPEETITQFIWPTDSRHSDSKPGPEISEKIDKHELDRLKSTRSIQSAQSFEETRNNRGPRDIDEALKVSSLTLMDKVEEQAKKIFSHKKEDELVSGESSDKDLLLLEEDEEATSALLRQIKKRSQVDPKDIQELKKEDTDKEMTEIVTPDETQSTDTRSDLIDLKSQGVRIQEPTEISSVADVGALSIILYDRKSAATTSKIADVGDEDAIPLTQKKSVRYKEENLVIKDASEHTLRNQSNDKTDNKKEDVQNVDEATDKTNNGSNSKKIKGEFLDEKQLLLSDIIEENISGERSDETSYTDKKEVVAPSEEHSKTEDKVSEQKSDVTHDDKESDGAVKENGSKNQKIKDKSDVSKTTDQSQEAGPSHKK